VSGFSAEWLALREPADWQARSTRVVELAAGALSKSGGVHVIDLAAGAGSNTRFLSRWLAAAEWLLVDHDVSLLERARQLIGFQVHTRPVDLSQSSGLAALVAGHDLVTASALLDLVSAQWLDAMCQACCHARAVVLFALSYDGRMTCSPEDAEDELIRTLVNRHQQRDKGFGPALGPDATERAAARLERLGFTVVRDRSDWALGRESTALQQQLLAGWAAASIEIEPGAAATIAGWWERRLAHVADGRSHIVVGHEDLGAFMA